MKHLGVPHFSCNPKSYVWGKNLHKLADKAEQMAVELDLDCLFTAQLIDLPYIVENCPHLTPMAQMIDPFSPRRLPKRALRLPLSTTPKSLALSTKSLPRFSAVMRLDCLQWSQPIRWRKLRW